VRNVDRNEGMPRSPFAVRLPKNNFWKWRVANFAAVQHCVGYPGVDRMRRRQAKIGAIDPNQSSKREDGRRRAVAEKPAHGARCPEFDAEKDVGDAGAGGAVPQRSTAEMRQSRFR
jgi:hypothetical protein